MSLESFIMTPTNSGVRRTGSFAPGGMNFCQPRAKGHMLLHSKFGVKSRFRSGVIKDQNRYHRSKLLSVYAHTYVHIYLCACKNTFDIQIYIYVYECKYV